MHGRVNRESRAEPRLFSHRATELCLMSDAASRRHGAYEWGHCASPEMCVPGTESQCLELTGG